MLPKCTEEKIYKTSIYNGQSIKNGHYTPIRS